MSVAQTGQLYPSRPDRLRAVFLFPVWATSQMAPRDCDSQRQSNSSGVHLAMDANQQYDPATIAILRRAFDEISLIRDFLIEDPPQRWKLPNISWPRPL